MTPAPFRVLDDVEVTALRPVGWVISEIIPARALVVLYGESGIGKSLLALDLVFAVATGREWNGARVTRGKVVYVAAEGVSGLRARVLGWKKAHGCSPTVREGVSFVPDSLDLLGCRQVPRFIRRFIRVRPRIVVIDTLARCLVGGDENSAKDMGLFVAAADKIRRALRCTVLVIHHPDKNNRHERGSGALRGAVDTMLLLRRRDGALSLECEKQKEAASFPPMALTLRRVRLRDGSESCVVRATGAHGPHWVAPLNDSQRRALEALPSDGRGVSSAEWRQTSGLPERTFHHAREALCRVGKVTKEGNGKRARFSVKQTRLAATAT